MPTPQYDPAGDRVRSVRLNEGDLSPKIGNALMRLIRSQAPLQGDTQTLKTRASPCPATVSAFLGCRVRNGRCWGAPSASEGDMQASYHGTYWVRRSAHERPETTRFSHSPLDAAKGRCVHSSASFSGLNNQNPQECASSGGRSAKQNESRHNFVSSKMPHPYTQSKLRIALGSVSEVSSCRSPRSSTKENRSMRYFSPKHSNR